MQPSPSPTFKPLPQHTSHRKRPTIINVPTDRKRPTIVNEPIAKRNKAERVCAKCKTSKCLHDSFSKNQRSKGDDAKCKDCIGAQQHAQQNEKQAEQKAIQEANRKRKEEKRLRQEEKRLRLEKERQDRIAIQKQQEEERKLAAQLLEAEEKKKTIAENEVKEANLYKEMKYAYESYAQKLKDSGKDIEQEMITPSNLLYVVTSISKRRDNNRGKFSPRLHGIYTTARKAQVCARHVFGNVSKSYRDGKFLNNEDRTAKSDISEFLIPAAEGNSRVIFELFGKTVKSKWSYEKDEYIFDCSAIASKYLLKIHNALRSRHNNLILISSFAHFVQSLPFQLTQMILQWIYHFFGVRLMNMMPLLIRRMQWLKSQKCTQFSSTCQVKKMMIAQMLIYAVYSGTKNRQNE